MKEYQFYALKDSNLTQNVSSLEIWFEKSGWRNLVQEIQFEKSGSRIRKKIQFLEPLFFPSQELEKFQLFPSKSESRLQIKSSTVLSCFLLSSFVLKITSICLTRQPI